MYRAIPSCNKILTNKWQQESHQHHLDNLKRIKGTVDCKGPLKFEHLKKKQKKT